MAKSRKSKLSKAANARRNTKGGRKRMSASSFALKKQKKYRIDDLPHARNALARVGQHGTAVQKKAVRAAVVRKFPSLKKTGRKKA
ncbi:DUF6582 domain-containing protein [Streptomyces sp. NPDC005407]|uniref:DUF6582 domain-containing protein n=1 Tax=Streptomyces sp. NPDC005407 TaxID=3155340 RepID=UPI00339F055B